VSRDPSARAVALGLLGLAAFSAFFLVRPFLGPLPPYGPRPAGTTYAYSFVVAAAFAPYALAVWGSRKGVKLRTALVGTAVLHLLVLPAALTQSQDLYMYLFYGKMWAVHGANPYLTLPLAFSSDPWFPWVRWPDQVSVYGPLWTLLTSLPARLAAGNLPLAFALAKALVWILGLTTVAGFIAAARSRGQPAGPPLLLGGWNPVVIVSLPLGGHADVAVIAALVWAMAADRRGRPVLAATLLAAAALVKAYAAVALVVYLIALARRGRVAVPAVAACAGLAVAAFAPFWEGWQTLRGLTEVAGQASASIAGEIQRGLAAVAGDDPAGSIVRALGLLIVGWVVLVGARPAAFRDDPWPTVAAAFLAYVLVTPWFLYWHQVGLLGLAALAASPGVRGAAYIFSGTSMLTASFGGTPLGRVVQAVVRYGPPLGMLVRASRRRRRPPRSTQLADRAQT
jgi:alpha-1,6-mannosyltransferase